MQKAKATGAISAEQLEMAKRCADAERAYGAACVGAANPWAGSFKRLELIEKQYHDEQLQMKGEHLAHAVFEYSRTLSELQAVSDKREALKRESDELDANPVLVRWRHAPRIAIECGFGHWFQGFRSWFESGRSVFGRTGHEVPGEDWPSAIVFDEHDRKIVRASRELESDRELLFQQSMSLQARRDALLGEFPELAVVSASEIDKLASVA